MTFPRNPEERLPRGDHDRRLSLGMDRDAFATEARVTPEQLRRYEVTPHDIDFDVEIAKRVGGTLERLEAERWPIVLNGPAPRGHNRAVGR